jgi:cell division septum initiation protein DivIVA
MSRSKMRGDDSVGALDENVPPDAETMAVENDAAVKEAALSARHFPSSRVSRSERDRMVEEARGVRFPIALRGYERVSVDRYVEQVNRLIAELEISASPESAVRHALHEVGEETRDLLQRAHQTADEITARSRAQADDRLQQAEREAQEAREATLRDTEQSRAAAQHDAQQVRDTAEREAAALREAATREVAELREKAARETQQWRAEARRDADELLVTARREAEEMVEAAESRAGELERNTETVWRERRRLIEDIRTVGEQLVIIGEAEAKRFPRVAEDAQLIAEVATGEVSNTTAEPASAPEETVHD